jgi:hypothetical protein
MDLHELSGGLNMKIFSFSTLERANQILSLLAAISVITGLYGLSDYVNQYAKVSYELSSPSHSSSLWIDDSEIVRYYEAHNLKMPEPVAEYIRRRSGLGPISETKKIVTGEFSFYPPPIDPNFVNLKLLFERIQIDKKLKLESYDSPVVLPEVSTYPLNYNEWMDQILTKVKKSSEHDYRVLTLALLSARRIENTIWLRNEGDLAAKNIKLYINVGWNLTSGAQGSLISILSLAPAPKPIIEDYRAVLTLPILKPKNGDGLYVITREAPLLTRNITLDYDTERKVNFIRMARFFALLLFGSIALIVTASILFKGKVSQTE